MCWTKIESGSLVLERSPLDLALLIAKLILRFELIATAKNVALASKVAPHLAAVDADPARIEQVLSNLIGNAVKFTPDRSTVEVSAREQSSALLITVTDTAPGMASGQIENCSNAIGKRPQQRAKGPIWVRRSPKAR